MSRRPFRLAFLSLPMMLVVFPLARAGDDAKKPTRAATEVEISFANGSLIRMVLAETSVEVQTDYGKLSIPARDLKRIDFGVHLPDGFEKQLDKLITELGSENFRVREAATTTLLRHGAMALPAVTEASKSSDLELSKRAKAVVAKLQQDLPGKELRTQMADTIVTPKFTFVGRILTPTLKAETEYFGPVTLDLVKLRSLRSTETPPETVLQIDAARYGGQALEWMKTDFEIDSRMKLSITASGQVDLWPQGGGGPTYMSSPKGFGNNPGFGRGGNRERFLPGALVGRIGESGPSFLIGDSYEGSPGQIVQSPWNNESSGSYQVKLSAK
jgi:hypothetical protein